MRKIFRILLATILVIVLGVLIYNVSLFQQEENFEKYAYVFNPNRNEIGLKEISKNWGLEKLTWNTWNELGQENYGDGKILKFIKIFSLRDITTGMIYENSSTDVNPTFLTKVIWFNSNILFWRNGIESEMDIYEKTIDSVTKEYLNIRYYFKDDNSNKNYFEANHSVIKVDEIYCGTSIIMAREEQRISGKPYNGNITKKQADSILKKWKEKI